MRAGRFGKSAAIAAAALALTSGFEGLRTHSYWDSLGRVWTACYGETVGVRRGQTYTPAQCRADLSKRLAQKSAALDRCLKADVPDMVYVAFLDATYNLGEGAACRSSWVRLANAGQIAAACNRLPLYDRAGGRVVPGLVRRRAAERRMCLEAAAGR